MTYEQFEDAVINILVYRLQLIYKVKRGQVDTALLDSRCRMGQYNVCV